jgi:hypothetical protein
MISSVFKLVAVTVVTQAKPSTRLFYRCVSMAWLAKATNDLPMVVVPLIGRECCSYAKSACRFYFEACCCCTWASSKLADLSGFSPPTSLICFLWLVKPWEHNCPFVSDFGFLQFWLGLGSSLFVLPFPLCWVLSLIKVVRFHHLT